MYLTFITNIATSLSLYKYIKNEYRKDTLIYKNVINSKKNPFNIKIVKKRAQF